MKKIHNSLVIILYDRLDGRVIKEVVFKNLSPGENSLTRHWEYKLNIWYTKTNLT